MSAQPTPHPAPAGLDKPGLALWCEVLQGYGLRVDELRLLEEACRTVDVLARLVDALQDAPLTVAGSMGQMREHPLLAEARQQRIVLARLLAQLKLPEEDELHSVSSNRSTLARHAAQSRWSTPGTAS